MRMISIFVALSVLGLGCGADDGDAGTVGEGTGDSTSGGMTSMSGTMTTTTDATTASTSMTTDTATTDPATSDPATTDPATTDPATTDTPTDGSGDATGPGDTTGEPADPCAPALDDTDCDTCVKEGCCMQLTACAEDPECVCFQDCAGSMRPSLMIPMICGDMCGIATPFAHPTVGQVLSCSAGCIGACGI